MRVKLRSIGMTEIDSKRLNDICVNEEISSRSEAVRRLIAERWRELQNAI